MMRRSLGKISQLVRASLVQQSASLENISSSEMIVLNQRALSVPTSMSNWDLHSWRFYSSESTGNGNPPSSNNAQLEGGNSPVPVPSAAVSSPLEPHAALDAWGDAMDNGDWEGAWDIFESSFPVNGPEFPELEELLAWDPDAEDKAGRRQREKAMQEETARARVVKIDDQGRAHGVGKRKTSVARVWIRAGPGHVMVNKRPYDAYFPSLPRRNDVLAPFFITDTLGRFDVMAAVEGGGATGQAQALRHGIARALQNWDPEMRTSLKTAGLLTRDARIVERKKPGKKKARKSFAWVKR